MPARSGAIRSKWGARRVLLVLGAVAALCALAATLTVFFVVRRYSQGLPSVETLKSGYDPPQVSRIYAADETLLSSVFEERRTVIPFERIPDVTKLAFLAAEDAHFYEHKGLNYLGLLRALVANLRAGRTVQGGSTITQQVVKNILLDQRRTYRRKIRETILALRLERHLTKDEIYSLYLNHIYLGHGRYGVEEAARYYFGKRAADLSAAESALLAGLVASPERYTPRRALDKALRRRAFVLTQMHSKGFITDEFYETLSEAPPPRLAPAVDAQSQLCPEAVSSARALIAQVQEERGGGGYTVATTIEPKLQLAARTAIRNALSEYADRHKLWPPYQSQEIRAWGPPFSGTPKVHGVYVGVVEAVDDARGSIRVRVGNVVGEVRLSEEERYNPKFLPASEFAKLNSVLRVRLLALGGDGRPAKLRLELGPQAALVAIDVRTRNIVALAGSHEALPGGLDRARRARRQPGSAFKAFVYAHALRSRSVSPASVLELEQPGRGLEEEPPYRITVRRALAYSNNEAASQLLVSTGPREIVALARELGVESTLRPDVSLALGAYEVTPLEMANAYATFASGGLYQPPRLMASLSASNGESLPLPEPAPPRRVMSAEEAYLITSLLRSVVTEGTGKRALALRRPLAGKTGTTNDSRDAWFVGYSTDLSVAVWVGFDDTLPLGKREGGSRTALPAFVEFMRVAHEGRPAAEFTRPAGIELAAIDPATGLLPRPGQRTITEEFLEGTVPESVAPDPADNTAEMPYKPGRGVSQENPSEPAATPAG